MNELTHIRLHQLYPGLSSLEIDVYFCLREIARRSGSSEVLYAQALGLTEIIGISVSTLRHKLKALAEAGLIQPVSNGCGRASNYVVVSDSFVFATGGEKLFRYREDIMSA